MMSPSGGKPVGAANKITQSLREQVLAGFSDIPAFVKELKRDYPPAAAGLLARLIPPAETAEDTPQGGTVIVNIYLFAAALISGPSTQASSAGSASAA